MKKYKGNTTVEYIVIALSLTSLLYLAYKIAPNFQEHYDRFSSTLSIPL